MKFIVVALFFIAAFCLQQKPVSNFTKPESFHTHSDDSFALKELIEVIFTGHISHIHEHNDHDDTDSHSHPHEHTSPKFVTLFDFLPENFVFIIESYKSTWPLRANQNLANNFQSDILRPPIS